ncbi:uncharacterized protein LOC116165508 isoform X2 [Photinus pyralis]|uniref:Uncharacterized protein n=1 Tax=Photinus pyralis TaxID=7054 RepID=A0A1Y1NL52_PHOPY|nr:uncharacterized protein LOC116165508 isoform X2 [Photinus pyralis]
MRFSFILLNMVMLSQVNCQFWKFPQDIFNSFSWLRQGKTTNEKTTTQLPTTTLIEKTRNEPSTKPPKMTKITNPYKIITVTETIPPKIETKSTTKKRFQKTKPPTTLTQTATATPIWTTVVLTTLSPTTIRKSNPTTTGTTETEMSTILDTTTQDAIGTTEEPRDNHHVHDFYLSKREKPQVKIASNISQNLLPLPEGASAALVKPTKYHYYPHNQHIFLLPECAIQQVCNAVYVRLNWTQPLCACPSRYRDPCSASLNSDDQHTTELMTDQKKRRALTLVKTCEPTAEMRICRNPRDWSLLALQNIRTGKSHYLVICRCPDTSTLQGPMSHDQPTYASVPGIRVYGMMCVQAPKRRARIIEGQISGNLVFPWDKVKELLKTAVWD